MLQLFGVLVALALILDTLDGHASALALITFVVGILVGVGLALSDPP